MTTAIAVLEDEVHEAKLSQPIIVPTITENHEAVEFNATKHLNYVPPSKIITMVEIGYPEDLGVSPVAVSEPFQLFNDEAIQQMRAEIFKAEVMSNCKYKSNIAACQLRGFANKYAPFIYDAWNHPDTLKIVSNIAGVDLIPAMDLEIGHVNLSVKSAEQTEAELKTIDEQRKLYAEDEAIAGCPWEDDRPVVDWHRDSYPFVCVLMLSDCTNMVGGETAIRTGNQGILKVRGPQMGCAVVLQGRYLEHQALRALGAQERITMVTSFRPRSPMTMDDSVLSSVRAVSNLSDLYYEFGDYRLEILEERVRAERKKLHNRRSAGKKFATPEFKKFLEMQEKLLSHTDQEIVDDDKVVAGFVRPEDVGVLDFGPDKTDCSVAVEEIHT